MVGKQLSALLQILRSQGVAEYQLTTEEKDGRKSTVSLKLGPAAAPRAAKGAFTLDEVLAQPDDDDPPPEDFRFGLERTSQRFFGNKKADPTKAKTS